VSRRFHALARAAIPASLCGLALVAWVPLAAARADDKTATAAGSEQLFSDANGAFLSGDLARAAAAWQALLEEGVVSPELETNLGTALLRQGKRGLAALHFERALHLDQGDDDARADLVELRRNNVDRLEGEEEGGAEQLYRLLAPLPGSASALLLVVAWTLAWILFAARLFWPALAGRQPIAAAAAACFAVALLAGAVTAAAEAGNRIALRRGVIVAASVPAREGPQAKAVSPFEVHEGTVVRVDDSENGFRRIKLQNGLTGWVPAEAVELVIPPQWGGLAIR
jgi:Bacterial SH3 domain